MKSKIQSTEDFASCLLKGYDDMRKDLEFASKCASQKGALAVDLVWSAQAGVEPRLNDHQEESKFRLAGWRKSIICQTIKNLHPIARVKTILRSWARIKICVEILKKMTHVWKQLRDPHGQTNEAFQVLFVHSLRIGKKSHEGQEFLTFS